MVRRKWRNLCLRANICTPDKIVMYKKTKLAHVESNALGKSETLLREAIQLTAPEWWDDETKFCLNRNVRCEKHVDSGNTGHSYVLFLGDFTGGALLFEDGTRLEEKYKWHRITGPSRTGTSPTRAPSTRSYSVGPSPLSRRPRESTDAWQSGRKST